MATDYFLGVDPSTEWFDGNDHSWTSVLGGSASGTWNTGAAVGLTSILVKWHYGGAFAHDGSPGSVAGAAGAFVIEGSPDGSSWTAVVTDADPVTTASASYPGDFEHTYSFALASYQYWRFRSTSGGQNNDVYTISGYGPIVPIPGVFVDWDDDDGDFEDGAYDQLPLGHIAKWIIRRGAGPRIIDSAQPGSLLLELNNPADDRYNPLNATGPLYGMLKDGRPVWIGVNSDGTLIGDDPIGLFGGRTTIIRPIPQGGGDRAVKVEIEAEDALGWYRRLPARIADGEGRSHAALRQEMLDDAGETRYDLAHEIHTMPLSSWDGDLLAGLEAINQANGTRHYCDPADSAAEWYAYTTRNRQWKLDAVADASIDAGTDHATSSTGWDLDADTVVNEQKATVVPVTFTPSSTTVWRAEGLPWVVTTGTPKTIFVEFDDYVRDPDLSVNYTGTAPTTTLTPFGKTAKLTITSAGTTTVTSALISGALARRGTAVSVVIDDTASQAGSRGVRAGSEISGDFVGVEASARGIASHIVWRYADPQFRPQLVMQNWIPEQFQRDCFDLLAVTIAELKMTDLLFEVVGLQHEGLVAATPTVRHHVTTYYLQESRVQDAADFPWFLLDSSLLDGDDVLAY